MAKIAPTKSKSSAKPKKGMAEEKSERKKKAPKDEEPPSDDEAESEAEGDDEIMDDDEEEAQETDEEGGEEEEEEEEEGEEEEEDEEEEEEDEEAAAERERIKAEKAEKQRLRAEKYAISKPRRLAKTRGFRQLAKKGGFSNQRPGLDQSKDVASNIVPIADVVRACKWKPCMPEDPAYGNLEEFKLRSDLANEPLPPGAAAVFRAGTEVFARELMYKATQAALDQGSTTITPAIMDAVVKPMRRVLRFTCGPPLGLVRYAQTCDTPGKMLRIVGDDETDMDNDLAENNGVQNDQLLYAADLESKMLEKKAQRAAAKGGKPKAAPKKAGRA
jgi:hypothetical protein